MRTTISIFLLLLFTLTTRGQSKQEKTYQVITFDHYDYEYANEYDDSYRHDTLFTFADLPFKKDRKIYHDLAKNIVATSIHFDTINHKIITKHFDKSGKLKKEQQSTYTTKKNYDPYQPSVNVKNVDYLKTYYGDSLICKLTVTGASMLIEYNNYMTGKYFEKIIYYNDNEVVGSVITEFYKTKTLKSICRERRESSIDNEGNTVVTGIYFCDNFDENGCVKKE